MLVVFFELWAAPASILGRPGQVSEPSKPHLAMFFGVGTRVSQKCSSCNKTTVFAMFYRLRNMPHTATEHVFCIAVKAFLDMVHGLLQKIPAGIHLLLVITTLQRGGTCAAHGIGAKLVVLGSQDPSQNLQNPIFWTHFAKMLPKRFQSGSKGLPRRVQRSIFKRFLMDLGNFFVIFGSEN